MKFENLNKLNYFTLSRYEIIGLEDIMCESQKRKVTVKVSSSNTLTYFIDKKDAKE